MTFLLLNYINISLLIYFIYSLIIISIASLINKLLNRYNSTEISLTHDQYFVMNNSYNVEKIFYFITSKLYQNKILLLNLGKSTFSLNKDNSFNLNSIELEVSNLYKDNFSPKEFTPEMINENIFKAYFDSIYNDLIANNFIKSKNNILASKIIFIIGLLVVAIPGISILISFYFKGIFLSKIIVGLFINIFIYIFFLKNTILTNLTIKGCRANGLLKNKYYSTNRKFTNNTYANDMDKFLIQNCYMYYFDYDNDNIDDCCDDGDD